MYTKCKLLREGLGATPTTWYEKKCRHKIQCLTLIPTQVTKMRTISKATLWTNTKLAKCMETPLMAFRDVNNIALVLCQGDQELNNPYTFVDE